MAERKATPRRGTRLRRRAGLSILLAGAGLTALGAPSALAQEVEEPSAFICAFVWNDLDADGVIDDGEPPMVGVYIALRLGEAPWDVLGGAITDENGELCFLVNPEIGPYKIEEFTPVGFVDTTPTEYYPIEAGGDQVFWDFGNRDPQATTTTASTLPPSSTTDAVATSAVGSSTTAAAATSTTVLDVVVTPAPTTASGTGVTATTTAAAGGTTTSLLTTQTAQADPTTTATVLAGTLPETGGEADLAILGVSMMVVGGLLTAVRRKPA